MHFTMLNQNFMKITVSYIIYTKNVLLNTETNNQNISINYIYLQQFLQDQTFFIFYMIFLHSRNLNSKQLSLYSKF